MSARPGRQHAAARQRPPAAGVACRGYTLLELLIVAALLSFLMLGVWALFRNWSNMYAHGEVRALRLQLVRSLCDQFTEDLLAVTPGAVVPADAQQGGSPSRSGAQGGSSLAEQNALVGGADWLVLTVVQPLNPWQYASDADASPTLSETSSDEPVLAAPELCRVVYSFTPPQPEVSDSLSSRVAELAAQDDTELVDKKAEEEEKEPTGGLSRLVIAHEVAMGASSTTLLETLRAGARDDAADLPAEVPSQARPPAVADAADTADKSGAAGESQADRDRAQGILQRDEVPEVATFSLRYFDGTTWSSSWNSQSQGRLPAAVELRFTLEIEGAEDPFRQRREGKTDDDTEPVSSSTSTSTSTSTLGLDDVEGSLSGLARGPGEEADDEVPPYERWVVLLGPAPRPSGGQQGDVPWSSGPSSLIGPQSSGPAMWSAETPEPGAAPVEPVPRRSGARRSSASSGSGAGSAAGEAPAAPVRRKGSPSGPPRRRSGAGAQGGQP